MSKLALDYLEETSPGVPLRRPGGVEFTFRSGDRPLDGYTIKRGIGFGGFGEVYYALSDGGKEVALKLVQRHLDIELRGVSHCLNLKSPHLVSVFDVRTNARGENWIVMEYMSGSSLQAELEKARGPLPFETALHWLKGITIAIDDLHANGIVHRDLKPGNVFSETNVVKVGDYGLSKFITHSRRSGQTQSVGTVHYMAPEISTGNYGRGVDIYSAAVMAFEMLSGEVPFDGETAGEILMKHLTAEPALEKIDPKFRGIFAKALAKNPLDRFQSAGELFEVIQAVGRGQPAPEFKPMEDLAAKLGFIGNNGAAKHAEQEYREAAARPVGPRVQPKPSVKPQHRPELLASLPPLPGTFKAKRRELSETMWNLFLAGLMSIVLPILALTAAMVVSKVENPNLAGYISMAVMTGVSSWGVILLSNLWDQQRLEPSVRRFNLLLFGFAIGGLALYMNLWLDQQIPSSIRERIGADWSLAALLPTLLKYLTALGLCFAIPDWSTAVDRMRLVRFSVGKVIWAGLLGVFLGKLIGVVDANWLGGVMAMTSVVVQWVTPKSAGRGPIGPFATAL